MGTESAGAAGRRSPGGHRAAAIAGALTAVAAIGWLDDLSGAAFSLALLYLIPTVAAGWWLGPLAGATTALAAGGAWLLDELGHDFSPLAHTWNASSRLLILLVAALAAARLRRERESQRPRSQSGFGTASLTRGPFPVPGSRREHRGRAFLGASEGRSRGAAPR